MPTWEPWKGSPALPRRDAAGRAGRSPREWPALKRCGGYASGRLYSVGRLQHGASGDADGYLLRRGISAGTTAFASLGRSGTRVRIMRSRDAGTSWTTLLEESTSNDHYYWFHTDSAGNGYAVRHSYYSTALCSLER
jgi:hypothetical protein